MTDPLRKPCAAIVSIFCMTLALPAHALADPPCTSVPSLPGIVITPISNGFSTYCVSDYGWSDAWFVASSPPVYSAPLDVLSGDDAPNLHFGIRGGDPWEAVTGFGWLSPVMDGGFLSPVRATGSTWMVVSSVAVDPGLLSARSVIAHPSGMQVEIDTALGAVGAELRQTFTLVNTTTDTMFEDIVFADYFNYHPNGSSVGNFRKGTISYSPLTGLTVTGPDDGTLIAVGTMRGERIDDLHGTNATFPTVPDIAIDQAQTLVYPDPTLPDAAFAGGPGDVAGSLAWRLDPLGPGERTSFTIFKQSTAIRRVPEPGALGVLGLASMLAAVVYRRRTGIRVDGSTAARVWRRAVRTRKH